MKSPSNRPLGRLRDLVSGPVSKLVLGTGGAQAIMLAALLILTRLYTPAEFGVLASFSGLLVIGAVSSCLRLDIAIPLPEADEEGASVLILALLSALALAVGVSVLLLLPIQAIDRSLQVTGLERFVWLLPLGILIAGFYNGLQHWSTRKKEFRTIAQTRISQALAGAGTQVGFGLAGGGPFGLLLGQVLNSGAGFVRLAHRAATLHRESFSGITTASLRRTASKYRRFPLFSFPESLANTATFHLPPLLIAGLLSQEEAGAFYLALRVMYAPMGLIGVAVSQVFLSRAGSELRQGTISTFTLELVSRLLGRGVGPIIFVGIMGPVLFELGFGANWERAGDIATWLSVALALQFVVSSIQVVLPAVDRQEVAVSMQVLGLLFRLGSIIGAVALAGRWASEAFGISSAIFFVAYFMVIARILRFGRRQTFAVILRAAPVVLAWVALGIAGRLLIT